jgi:sugar (pentulose or hexulose) kinase
MRADIVQRPVELPSTIDCAPIGAALLAAVAGGLARDLPEAVGALSDGHADLAPDPRQADAYDTAHDRYRQLFGALRPLFTEPPRN